MGPMNRRIVLRPLLTAFFGRTDAKLSVVGLEHLLTYPEVNIVSVTCGRRKEDQELSGPLQRLATLNNIPTMTLDQVRQSYSELDLVISFSNPVIFPNDFIEASRFGCINMHPAPLPFYRGCHGIEHALLNDEKKFGSTLHFCNSKIDAGPIIEVRWVDIEEHDTATDIWKKVDEVSLDLLRTHMPRVIEAAASGKRIEAQPQDQSLARYYRDDSYTTSEIDLRWPTEKIIRFVRAMTHPVWERAFFFAGGKRISLSYVGGSVVVDSIVEVESETQADAKRSGTQD
jgi:methionyl-tRNA formyltransferase